MSKHIVLVGAQWGDEGKGKIVDYLSEKADIVVRFQGGNNAGHTVIVGDQKIVLHFIPSGILRSQTTCLIGNGVVVNLKALFEEVQMLTKLGIDISPANFRICENAHLILPYHIYMDQLAEQKRGAGKIGTTHRGIGPAYADKYARVGLKIGQLRNEDAFDQQIQANVEMKNCLIQHYYNAEPIDLQYIQSQIKAYKDWVLPFLTHGSAFLKGAHTESKNILFEGAQGTALDIDHGTYPFVTSSSTVAGAACSGSGFGPTHIDRVMGVCKAYTTRVGSGAFPTELHDNIGELIAQKGFEFGATTGRPRRCGWLDLVFLKHAIWVNGITDLAITKLDVLNDFEEVSVCIGYEDQKGNISEAFVSDNHLLGWAKPVYKHFKGWKGLSPDCKTFEDLPTAAQDFLTFIGSKTQVEISMISTGPKRSDQITCQGFF